MAKSLVGVWRVSGRVLQVLILVLMSAGAWSQDSASGKPFDHHNTGFPLEGAHAFVPCQSCHVDGEFKGTPRDCVGCHSPNARFNATFKPVTHIPSTDQCDACHRPTLWEDVTYTDHTQVLGPCLQCHNNQQVYGQHPGHLPTSLECDQCHSDMSWVPANFSHESLVTTCVGCHNNVQVGGKPVDHINVVDDCAACHTNTLHWTPVMSVDHDFVVGTCTSCHNNVVAGGQPPGHIPTGDTQCNVCHSIDHWSNPMLPSSVGEF